MTTFSCTIALRRVRRSTVARTSAVVALGVLPLIAGCRPSSPASSTVTPQSATAATLDEAPSANGAAPAATPPLDRAELGPQLYARHCAACHGERGDGQGLAASWLFPKPRDFRAGRFRLVSTSNNVPTRDDLHAVLERGMPGSAMPPWPRLTLDERDALVDEVLRLRAEGARESYVDYLRNDEELTDEELADDEVQEEIQGVADDATTPGRTTDVPQIADPTDDAVERGRSVYVKFGCVSCHGDTGRGDGVQAMFDAEQMPTSPRDFTLGIFKGDPAPASLFRRIVYGMPGTPMPGSSAMTPNEAMDTVHYIRSLSSEAQRQAAVLRRATIVAARVNAIPESEQDDAWFDAPAAELHLTPLWWRTSAVNALQVQAVHDGETVVVRLTWADEVDDRRADRTESFEDAAAMQLFAGQSEPFLGMGDKDSPVDVWFWDADRQGPAATLETTYPNAVNDGLPFSESAAASAELDRVGARWEDQPDVSLPARASGNQITPPGDGSGGTSLHVGGPGSVTFRPRPSQLVRAHGVWSDGRWTVVMERQLAASPEDGVSLQPGQKASVAFAVWDGAHDDRNGQKSITIWQDLELEE